MPGSPPPTGPNSSDPDGEFSLDVELPDDSVFTIEDYEEMHHAASSNQGRRILDALTEHDSLTVPDLMEITGMSEGDLHTYIRRLTRTALIATRRRPTVTREYYTLTDPGRVVQNQGPQTGVRKLAEQEAAIASKYSE